MSCAVKEDNPVDPRDAANASAPAFPKSPHAWRHVSDLRSKNRLRRTKPIRPQRRRECRRARVAHARVAKPQVADGCGRCDGVGDGGCAQVADFVIFDAKGREGRRLN
jgi:hypothetical protein